MNDLTVQAKTQIIEVNPATGTISIVNAGPAGPPTPGPAGESVSWRGAWAVAVDYEANDIVFDSGSMWIALDDHTSVAGQNPPVATTHWSISARGFNWRGTWSSASVAYKLYDVAYDLGSVWLCTTAHTSTATRPNSNTNWTIFARGFSWLGTWSSGSVAYKVNDVVQYNGSTWVCITAHTSSGANTPVTTANWQLLARGSNWLGAWVSGTTYRIGDVVSYNGSSYRAVVDITAAPATTTDPATSGSAVWLLVASKGDQGASGAPLAYSESRPGTNTVSPPSGYAVNTWYDVGPSVTFTTSPTTTKVKVTLSIYVNANSATTVTAILLWGLRTAANALVANSDHRAAGAASGTAAYAGKITSTFVLDVTASTTYTWKWGVQVNTAATWNQTAGLQFPATMIVEALN